MNVIIKKTRVNAETRKNQIIDAAIECFGRKGFKGTTTKEISKKVGISEAMLFRYFGNKENFYVTIFTKKSYELEKFTFPTVQAEARDDFGVFKGLTANILTFNIKYISYFRLFFQAVMEERKDVVNLIIQNQIYPLVWFLRNYIDCRTEEGAFKKIDSEIASRSFLGIIMYFGVIQLIKQTLHEDVLTFNIDKVSTEVANIYLGGLRN